MDVLTLLRMVTRHWRVTVPAMLLTLLGGLFVLQTSGPTYRAGGAAVLLTPPAPPEDTTAQEQGNGNGTPSTTTPQNPYTRFGDLSLVADVVARRMASDVSRDALLQKGVDDYEIFANQFNRGPVIEVTGEADTPEAAVVSTQIVLDEISTVLFDLQEESGGGDPAYFITADVLTTPTNAAALYGSTVRVVVGVLAIGSLLTLAVAVLAETVPPRWREWRAQAAAASDAESPAGDGGTPAGANGSAAAPAPSTSPYEPVSLHRPAYLTEGRAPTGADGPGDGSNGADRTDATPDLGNWSTTKPDGGGRPFGTSGGRHDLAVRSIGGGWSPAEPKAGGPSAPADREESPDAPTGDGGSSSTSRAGGRTPRAKAGRRSRAKSPDAPTGDGGSSSTPRAGGRAPGAKAGRRSTAKSKDDDRPDANGDP